MDWWREQRDATPDPFATLDRHVARTTLRLEGDEELATLRRMQAESRVDELERRAADPCSEAERDELLQRVAVEQRQIAREETTVDRLQRELQSMRETPGEHLDSWMAEHGEQAARWLAAARVVAAAEQGLETKVETAPAAEAAREPVVLEGEIVELHPPEPALESPAAAASFEM